MSRGLGRRQRAILGFIYSSGEREVSVRYIKDQLCPSDRSNFRRAVRGMVRGGYVREIGGGADSRLALLVRGIAAAYHLFEPPLPDPVGDAMREFDHVASAFERALTAADDKEQRRRQEKADLYPAWFGWGRLVFRSPGPAQIRILKILWALADPRCAGLPVAVVVEISGLEKSNARRAIAGLLDRGYLDITPDRTRVRISADLERHYLDDWLFPAPPLEAVLIDRERAEEILRRRGEDISVPDPTVAGVTIRRSSRKFSAGRQIRR